MRWFLEMQAGYAKHNINLTWPKIVVQNEFNQNYHGQLSEFHLFDWS